MEEKIKKMIKELGATKYKKHTWGEYEVYQPIYAEPTIIGMPIVVLVKGNEVRYSNDNESIEFLKYLQQAK